MNTVHCRLPSDEIEDTFSSNIFLYHFQKMYSYMYKHLVGSERSNILKIVSSERPYQNASNDAFRSL